MNLALQAIVPRKVREKLKPWQLEGLLHLFDTIILDHEADLRLRHLREQRTAAQVP